LINDIDNVETIENFFTFIQTTKSYNLDVKQVTFKRFIILKIRNTNSKSYLKKKL